MSYVVGNKRYVKLLPECFHELTKINTNIASNQSRGIFLLFSYSYIMDVIDGLLDCGRETSLGVKVGRRCTAGDGGFGAVVKRDK